MIDHKKDLLSAQAMILHIEVVFLIGIDGCKSDSEF